MILSASSADQRNKWVSDVELAANRMKNSKEPFHSTSTGQPTHIMHVMNVSAGDEDRFDEHKMKQNTTTQVQNFRTKEKVHYPGLILSRFHPVFFRKKTKISYYRKISVNRDRIWSYFK